MTAWYEPPSPAGTGVRADCVAQIVTDLNANIVTDASGHTTLDVAAFMALAATRLAAIPDPSTPGYYYSVNNALRSTDVRPYAEKLVTDLAAITTANAGSVDLASLLADLKAKSDAVTAYYNTAYSSGVAAILLDSLTSGSIDQNMPPADDTTPETRYYRTTFVTDWEEESAPSDVSASIDVAPKDSVTITVGAVPAGRHISYWRAYRSNVGNEKADYQYVPYASNDLGVPIATTTLSDAVPNSQLLETCPTTIWAEPPTNLQGLIGMANSFHMGFFGNTLCPSVADHVYAYPSDYRKTVGWPIVGLAAWEQMAFVGTRGKPSFFTGTSPDSLAERVLDSNQACTSARSICSTDAGVVYASPDGLCLATPDGVRVVTDGLFTREEWQALDPTTMIVQENDGVVHIVCWPGGAVDTSAIGWNPADVFDSMGTAGITVSGNVVTVTAVAGDRGVRGLTPIPVGAGKIYAEFVNGPGDNSFFPYIGFFDPAFPLSEEMTGSPSGSHSWGVTVTGGAINNSGTPTPYGTATRDPVAQTTVMLAFDAASRKWWAGVNGTWFNSGNPAIGTNPGGTITAGVTPVPGTCTGSAFASRVTMSTSYTYPPPDGFTNYPDAVAPVAPTIYSLNIKDGKLVTLASADVTAVFRDIISDSLCVANGADVKTLFTGSTRLSGTWTKRIVLPNYANFGWLEVESDFTDADGSAAAVTVALTDQDGVALDTLTATERTPQRVVPFREKEIVVSVTSKARVTAVRLASTVDELRAL